MLSKPFSADQYWICLEMVAENESLVIARVRQPRHPDTPATLSEEDDQNAMRCGVATMAYVRQNLSTVKIPRV